MALFLPGTIRVRPKVLSILVLWIKVK